MMGSLKDWADTGVQGGVALLMYDLILAPLSRGYGSEAPPAPWKLGALSLGFGIALLFLAAWREARKH